MNFLVLNVIGKINDGRRFFCIRMFPISCQKFPPGVDLGNSHIFCQKSQNISTRSGFGEFSYFCNEILLYCITLILLNVLYRYQVVYQCGVLISRSSTVLFHIKHFWILSVLQVPCDSLYSSCHHSDVCAVQIFFVLP